MNTGQAAAIWHVPYEPAVGAGPFPAEVLTFAGLRRMDPGGRRTRLQRPQFHVLAFVQEGRGRHRADFVEHPLRPGTIVWIRPGAVHQWSDVDAVEGSLVLFTPGAADHPEPPDTSSWQASRTGWDLARHALDHFTAEHRAAGREPHLASGPILRLLLGALLLRAVGTAPAGPFHRPGGRDDVFRRYRAEVEEHFAAHHQVAWYARRLGYAPRTLTRATRVATGVGAKQFLDERIALEAKRLLAHTDLTVARCARRLGFADPANFTNFFQRHTGTPPGPWRRAESPSLESLRHPHSSPPGAPPTNTTRSNTTGHRSRWPRSSERPSSAE